MPGSTNERLAALLDRGFGAWAHGDVVQAVTEWRRAAAMDPQGEAARLILLANALFPELAGGAPRAAGDELLGARTGWPLVGEPVVLPAGDDDSVPHAIATDDSIEAPQPGWARTPHGIEVIDGAPLRAMTLAIPSHPNDGGGRARHMTLPSPIPALLAAGVGGMDAPGAPPPEDTTRPMDEREFAAADAHSAPTPLSRPAQLIDGVARVQQAVAAGAIGMAVELAESALSEAEQAPGGTPQDMLDAARPVCERAFSAYVGSLTGVPALLVPKALLATQKLSPLGRRLVYQINGSTPIERILEMTGTTRYEGLRALASLLRTGVIRIN